MNRNSLFTKCPDIRTFFNASQAMLTEESNSLFLEKLNWVYRAMGLRHAKHFFFDVVGYLRNGNARFTPLISNWELTVYRAILRDNPGLRLYNASDQSLSGSAFSRVIDPSGKVMGRNKMYKFLREHGIFDHKNHPTPEYWQSLWFDFVEVRRRGRVFMSPLFTPAGMAHLTPLLLEEFFLINI